MWIALWKDTQEAAPFTVSFGAEKYREFSREFYHVADKNVA